VFFVALVLFLISLIAGGMRAALADGFSLIARSWLVCAARKNAAGPRTD
jgi:hypothetical protein